MVARPHVTHWVHDDLGRICNRWAVPQFLGVYLCHVDLWWGFVPALHALNQVSQKFRKLVYLLECLRYHRVFGYWVYGSGNLSRRSQISEK
ncbi:hypothetical protein RAY_83 [Erwinia phage vB_EamM_RAY]|uniref:Uncharacterized protein n=5 Tax=Agricanvirus TaxID=1984776 RepID=A0A173GDT5_9CAUD|nr:hypothetical protein FDH98_gp083 [Erwinia phage vB_EamM_RAY]YP_009605870.1 hypothetical protein FDH99_gp086 [Erwinia phage vB_EamM_Simmy50]YP_009621824.1 hypothetical protein FDJ23_gp083 [Erwinia phage vB_EamM_Desertfox]AUG86108.1 hypothetical protein BOSOLAPHORUS_84 [Erwinia phage vB_EamM_Bosolaphorus]AUG86513.1 hypothetical protein MADMEL_85 [Erwinia phage vB_EamM_MadMel]ANH51548.1 hypothetical protein SIMMY50_86 [Erwinia phage vB_EamM_Simmy50]ANH51864.1 hypothetical protein RAY_83 [Erwi